MAKPYVVGEWVVYTREKYSPSPGPRAKNVSPALHGELYSYEVDKYWAVREIRNQMEVVLETRRGKVHAVSIGDSRLRKPSLWERLFYSRRFPNSRTLDTNGFTETSGFTMGSSPEASTK